MFGAGLRFYVDDDGHLIAGSATRRCIWLRFLPEGLDAFLRDASPARLAWDDNRGAGWATVGRPADGWTITNWAFGRYGAYGIGVHVSGRCADTAKPLLAATETKWRKLARRADPGVRFGSRLPVVTAGPGRPWLAAKPDALRALTALVKARAPLRDRLGDRDRMRRLATDLVVADTSSRQRPDGEPWFLAGLLD